MQCRAACCSNGPWPHFWGECECEVTQLCLTLYNLMDCSLPGSSVHGIFQAIVLEWIAISFSKGSSQPRDQTQVSRIVDRRFTIWATREVHFWGSHWQRSYFWVKILFPSQYIGEAGAAKSRVNPTDFSAIDFTKEARKAAHFPTWPYSMSWSWTALAIEIWAFVLARGTCTLSEPLALLPALTVEHICYQEAESNMLMEVERRSGEQSSLLVPLNHTPFLACWFSDILKYFYCSTTQQFCYMQAKNS